MLPTRNVERVLRWYRSSGPFRATHTTSTVVRTADATMPTLLAHWSTTSRARSPVVVEKIRTERTAETPPTPIAAARRVIPNFSCTAAETTWRTETSDVKPARAREPKKRHPKMGPTGICDTIAGTS